LVLPNGWRMRNDSVEMVLEQLAPLPVLEVPGVVIRRMRGNDEGGLWTTLQQAAEPFGPIADDLFQKEFGFDEPAVIERCYLALDEQTGTVVGTCSGWYGKGDREHWGRIHWVATHPEYQRRGIARAMLHIALNRMHALGHEKAYLVTSTGRLGAIRLYRELGFVPDLSRPNAAEHWDGI
jgi:ribosomal protein S18 acetylase RimI-like enzyme